MAGSLPERHQAFLAEIKAELEPRMRRVCGHLSEQEFAELIDSMARIRLSDLINFEQMLGTMKGSNTR